MTFKFSAQPLIDSTLPLPEGLYPAVIKKAELKDNKALTGVNLVLKLEVQDRVLYDYLCVEHPNEKAQNYAHRKLKDICLATGLTQLDGVKPLIGKTVGVRLRVEFDAYATERGYGEDIYCNRVYTYHSIQVMGGITVPNTQKTKSTPKPKTRKDYMKEANQLPRLMGEAVKRGLEIPFEDFDDDIPF